MKSIDESMEIHSADSVRTARLHRGSSSKVLSFPEQAQGTILVHGIQGHDNSERQILRKSYAKYANTTQRALGRAQASGPSGQERKAQSEEVHLHV